MEEERSERVGLAAISPSTTLAAAARAFDLYMENEDFSTHTIRAFHSDLRLLGNYLGHDTPIGQISTAKLNKFLDYLLHEREVPCSPKSYARRVTTLKVFFKWLHKGGVLPEDPAAPVIQRSASTPLPEILTEEEIERALTVTQTIWSTGKQDPRPHLLLNLILHTAMKKAECMAIRLEHIDRRSADGPIIQIRYDEPNKKTKERKLSLPAEVVPALDAYIERYGPKDLLFPCTPRNLEYVISDVAEKAEIVKKTKKGISFEMLRWTAAVRDRREGMDEVSLRQKLGISEVTWQDTKKKIQELIE